ncbi:MAG: shikimate dehydrogenase [Kiloniellales bacterium]
MRLSGKAKLAGVIGWPVGHSRSPLLHGHWLERYGIDGAYLPLAVPPGRLATALEGLSALGFRGANVTIPHKEEALRLCTRLTPQARAIGAANTLIVEDDGLLGDNSDGFGFLANLDETAGWKPAGKRCLVLGAGGSSRAVIWSLIDGGAEEVIVTNRTAERAAGLAQEFGASSRPWEEREGALADIDLVVNTTSLGMQGQAALDLPLDRLPGHALVTDLVYAPLETPLLAAAARRGNPTVDGLGMLLHQARPGFAAWFGVEPQVDQALRSAVLG